GAIELDHASETFLHAPFARFRYHNKDTLGAVETDEVYRRALVAAGWKLIGPQGIGGIVVAHYASDGRDLWAKITPFGAETMIEAGDAGLQEAQEKLARQLDAEGHVALYGIY